MPAECAVATCKNVGKYCNGRTVSYHRFPKKYKRDAWIDSCHRQDKDFNADYARICSDHFQPSDFKRDLRNELLNLPGRVILSKHAVPTRNLPDSLFSPSNPQPWNQSGNSIIWNQQLIFCPDALFTVKEVHHPSRPDAVFTVKEADHPSSPDSLPKVLPKVHKNTHSTDDHPATLDGRLQAAPSTQFSSMNSGRKSLSCEPLPRKDLQKKSEHRTIQYSFYLFPSPVDQMPSFKEKEKIQAEGFGLKEPMSFSTKCTSEELEAIIREEFPNLQDTSFRLQVGLNGRKLKSFAEPVPSISAVKKMKKHGILYINPSSSLQKVYTSKVSVPGCEVYTSKVSVPVCEEPSSATQRKVVEILCFDGRQYRYIYRGSDSVCGIKLEIQGGVEIFVSMEDFDKLEPADVKPSPNKLLNLIVPDVSIDASPEEIVPSSEAVLSELIVKEEEGDLFYISDQGCNSDVESMEDDSNVLPEPCIQTDSEETKKAKSLCRENNQVYSCDGSKLTLKKKGQLQNHRTAHAQEHPFKCDHCSETFENKVHLERHAEIHLDKNSFLCLECGKIFSQNDNLKLHQYVVHNKRSPFNCDVCAQGFVTTQDFKNHVQKAHNEKTFVCEI